MKSIFFFFVQNITGHAGENFMEFVTRFDTS